jgi:ribosome-associated heat shock protein Hsp15
MSTEPAAYSLRVDKWLWAARFFKTRALAAEAVTGGKVEINGARSKPGHPVRLGDQLTIRRGAYEWVVTVKDMSKRRGPASEAQMLYEETQESARRRDTVTAQLKLETAPRFDSPGRPSKKDRRAMNRFTKRGR